MTWEFAWFARTRGFTQLVQVPVGQVRVGLIVKVLTSAVESSMKLTGTGSSGCTSKQQTEKQIWLESQQQCISQP